MNNVTIDVDLTKLYDEISCHAETIYRFNGVWEGPNPLTPIVPLFLVQLTVAVLATRLLIIVLKPFNQPPFVAEILSGIILGPSGFGRYALFKNVLFPKYYLPVLEPMAHYALVYYAFLMGLRMDIRAISRTGTQARHVAIFGVFIPMVIGSSSYFIVYDYKDKISSSAEKLGAFFWGSALTVTGFSVLSKILDKQKILHTEIGKIAVASALLSDIASWFFLALGLAITGNKGNIIWVLLSTCAVILVCAFYVRPALNWIIRKNPEGQGYSEYYICSIITGVSLLGVITDALGTHPMIGAFVFGLIIPNDVLESVLVDRLGDFVQGIFMPVFYIVCGLRADLDEIGGEAWIKTATVIILAFAAKIVSTYTVSILHDLPPREAVAVGILTNTKSTISMVILEIGLTQKALTSKTFSIMIVAILVMTMIVTPATILYRPSRNLTPYKRRTIQKAKSDEEFRILACIFDTRNIPAIINLLEVSNSTQRSPINVFALHLVELIGRASTMLVVHSSHASGLRNPSHLEAQTSQILNAFDNYKLQSESVNAQVLTASSAYATMDEDICSIAKDKRAAFIILPFHKQQTPNGDMEDINPLIRNVNESVMANAPCSVGILIARGLSNLENHARKIAMLFFGGPDDREALAYAWRMAEHPDTSLTVVRFIPGQEEAEEAAEWDDPLDFAERDQVTFEIDSQSNKLLDDDLLNKFKISTINDSSIMYSELRLTDEEEAANAIKEMDGDNYNFYIVGKGRGLISPLTTGLADWCDCPELGPIGDLLVTSEFESAFSVLVVQQYLKPSTSRDGSMRSAYYDPMSERQEMEFKPSDSESETFEPFASFRRRDHSPLNIR